MGEGFLWASTKPRLGVCFGRMWPENDALISQQVCLWRNIYAAQTWDGLPQFCCCEASKITFTVSLSHGGEQYLAICVVWRTSTLAGLCLATLAFAHPVRLVVFYFIYSLNLWNINCFILRAMLEPAGSEPWTWFSRAGELCVWWVTRVQQHEKLGLKKEEKFPPWNWG